jgi:hypothetical protein
VSTPIWRGVSRLEVIAIPLCYHGRAEQRTTQMGIRELRLRAKHNGANQTAVSVEDSGRRSGSTIRLFEAFVSTKPHRMVSSLLNRHLMVEREG